MHDEGVDVDTRVHVRVVVDGVGDGTRDEGQEGEREPFALAPLVAVGGAAPRATRSKSTSTDVYTCALVDFDRTMCSAVRRRMLLNGTTWSPVR